VSVCLFVCLFVYLCLFVYTEVTALTAHIFANSATAEGPRDALCYSCYVSQGMRVRKVSNSKSGPQGNSRALAMVPFDRPRMISY